MRVLITGAEGQLGRELCALLQGGGTPAPFRDAEVIAAGKAALDVTSREQTRRTALTVKPDVIFHCAAKTDVDACEGDSKHAFAVNWEGAQNIAAAAELIQAKLLLFSTDYVFSGENAAPYREEDECFPLNEYGKSKRAGELAALKSCSRAFVVRTSWLYGKYGGNFVTKIINQAKAGGTIRVVDDQTGSPTWARGLAFNSLYLAATQRYGVYHCAGGGGCSRYAFAQEILRLCGLSCEALPCKSGIWGAAARPPYSALCCDKISQVPGVTLIPWRQELRQFLSESTVKGEFDGPVSI